MTLVRRQPRSVYRQPRSMYRVYTEEEFLAGVDLVVDRDMSPAARERRGPAGGERRRRASGEPRVRSLHRVAGAVALTGAVGTVGGLIGVAVLHGHAVERPTIVAQLARPAARAAAGTGRSSRAPRARGVYTHPPRARGTRIETSHALAASHARAARVDMRFVPGARTEAPPAQVAKADTPPATTIYAVSVSRPAAPVSAGTDSGGVREEAVSPPPRRPVQSEFGFER